MGAITALASGPLALDVTWLVEFAFDQDHAPLGTGKWMSLGTGGSDFNEGGALGFQRRESAAKALRNSSAVRIAVTGWRRSPTRAHGGPQCGVMISCVGTGAP